MLKNLKKPLWSDENKIDYVSLLKDKNNAIFNLYEDIRCLKEDLIDQHKACKYHVDSLKLKIELLINNWPESAENIQALTRLVDSIANINN